MLACVVEGAPELVVGVLDVWFVVLPVLEEVTVPEVEEIVADVEDVEDVEVVAVVAVVEEAEVEAKEDVVEETVESEEVAEEEAAIVPVACWHAWYLEKNAVAVWFVIEEFANPIKEICSQVIPFMVSATIYWENFDASDKTASFGMRGAWEEVIPQTDWGTVVKLDRIAEVMGIGEVKAICIQEGVGEGTAEKRYASEEGIAFLKRNVCVRCHYIVGESKRTTGWQNWRRIVWQGVTVDGRKIHQWLRKTDFRAELLAGLHRELQRIAARWILHMLRLEMRFWEWKKKKKKKT